MTGGLLSRHAAPNSTAKGRRRAEATPCFTKKIDRDQEVDTGKEADVQAARVEARGALKKEGFIESEKGRIWKITVRGRRAAEATVEIHGRPPERETTR
jgi:hypothetical protein